MSKKLDPVKIDRLRELWEHYGLSPKVCGTRLGIPMRTVFAYIKQFREGEGRVPQRNRSEEA